jgi:KaiC/GvpD/RAD55 family RecA-like ATPase
MAGSSSAGASVKNSAGEGNRLINQEQAYCKQEIFSLAGKDKRSTGITGLDQTLDGGFPVGTCIVVMGSPLSGLDQMARQFWKVNGEEGTYLMVDGEVESGMADGRDVPPEQFLQMCQGERVVIDSISSVILTHGIDKAIRTMVAIRNELASRKANVLFTFYADLHAPLEQIKVMRTTDVFVELKEVIFMNEIERQLAIHKLKGAAVPRRLVPFLITEKGIELSTTSRVV